MYRPTNQNINTLHIFNDNIDAFLQNLSILNSRYFVFFQAKINLLNLVNHICDIEYRYIALNLGLMLILKKASRFKNSSNP
jgi:hypothetical protein